MWSVNAVNERLRSGRFRTGSPRAPTCSLSGSPCSRSSSSRQVACSCDACSEAAAEVAPAAPVAATEVAAAEIAPAAVVVAGAAAPTAVVAAAAVVPTTVVPTTGVLRLPLVKARVVPAVEALAVAVLELRARVADAVHPGEQRVEHQHRTDTPGTGHQCRLPPRFGVPARGHRTPGTPAAGVVVRRAARRGRRRLDVTSLDLHPAVLGHSAGGPLPAQCLQLGARVHAHRLARGADVVEAFHRAVLCQLRLPDAGGLLDLRGRGVIPLGRVGHRLLGCVIATGEIEHLTAEPLG